MNNGPILEYPGHDYQRTAVIVGVILLAVAAVILFIGPSNILQMLHLKDLETSPDVFVVDPYLRPMITARELRPYVVGRAPVPNLLWGEYLYSAGSADIYNTLYVFPVESGAYQLEICLENGSVVYAYLKDNATFDRLDVTVGADGMLYDEFTHLNERTEAQTDALPAEP